MLALDPKRVDALLAIGRVEIDSGNPQKGLEYLTGAQAMAIESGNDEERAEILQAMGVAYAGSKQTRRCSPQLSGVARNQAQARTEEGHRQEPGRDGIV